MVWPRLLAQIFRCSHWRAYLHPTVVMELVPLIYCPSYRSCFKIHASRFSNSRIILI
jgi:hypothetical protein